LLPILGVKVLLKFTEFATSHLAVWDTSESVALTAGINEFVAEFHVLTPLHVAMRLLKLSIT